MLKKMEKADGRSCWNKAVDNEMTFVLLGRDLAAPYTIREWCKERIRLGKNREGDHQITEALKCAAFMERSQTAVCLSPPRGLGCAPHDGKAVHRHSDDTWWFWDETWSDEIGPYDNQEIAERKCEEYAGSL